MKQAKWIWANIEESVNQYVAFKSIFSIDSVGAYVLTISVTGNYCIYINDRFVACSRFDDYPEYKLYDDIDIGAFLTTGKNEIYILAYSFGMDSCRSVAMTRGLIAEISDETGNTPFFTDEQTQSCLSPLYRSGNMPTRAAGQGFAIEIDMRNQLLEMEYQDSCCVKQDFTLFKRPCKRCETGEILPSILITQGCFRVEDNLVLEEKLHEAWLSYRHLSKMSDAYDKVVFPNDPLSLCGKGENIYMVFDLQAEQNGFLHFDFELNNDADVEFTFGEHLDDLRVRSEIGGKNFSSIIHGKKGRNIFTDYINRIACRYLQVHVYSDYCKIRYFGLIYVKYPLTIYPYETENLLRKKIYETCIKTLQECMHEHYEDCPWREQAFYAMDSRNQMLCGYYTFKEYEFARANLVMLFKRIRSDGHMYAVTPCGWRLTIPTFTLVGILAVWEYCTHSGDFSLAHELLRPMESVLNAFMGFIDQSGLLKRFTGDSSIWNFYEWTEGLWNNWGDHSLQDGSIEYPAILNAFFVVALESFYKIGTALDLDVDKYRTLSEELKQNLAKNFWDDEKKCFASYKTDNLLSHYHELTNAMLLYCGVGTQEQREQVAQILMTESFLAPMTISMMAYKYQALIDFNENNIQYVFKDIDEKWGSMLQRNATTFWETLKGADDFGGAGSLCHGWSAIPAYFYQRYGNYERG